MMKVALNSTQQNHNLRSNGKQGLGFGGARLKGEDTIMTAVMKLSEGNPGAMNVCMEIVEKTPKVDPKNILGGLGALMNLDSHDIYGHKIWGLFSDVCQKSAEKTIGVLRAVQLGLVNTKTLHHAIENRGAGLDVAKTLEAVKQNGIKLNLDVN